jgi:hypothetical protein
VVTIQGESGDYLRLTPRREVSASSYEATASIAGRVVRNDSPSLLGAREFVAALREFEQSRVGRAVLSGSYDFWMAIGPFGRAGAAWVELVLADYLPLPTGGHGRHVLEGGFVVGG